MRCTFPRAFDTVILNILGSEQNQLTFNVKQPQTECILVYYPAR